MLSDLIVFAAIWFVLGLKASRFTGAVINKIYSDYFYVPKTKITASVIGDAEYTTAAILKNEIGSAKFQIMLYSFKYIIVEMDAVSTKVDFSKTRLCLHDFATILPYKTGYNKDKAVFFARYLLPRPIPEGKSLSIWFFN